MFVNVLKGVEEIVPAPAKLRLHVNLENIHQYYAVAMVVSYATEDRLFQAYNILVYPVYSERIGKWMQWEVGTHK